MRVVSVVGASPGCVRLTPTNMALKDAETVLAYSRLVSEATEQTLEIDQGNLISATPTSVVLSPTPAARRRKGSCYAFPAPPRVQKQSEAKPWTWTGAS